MNEDINKKPRKSNIELLRIIAMMMIIVHHITCHCFKAQLVDNSMFAFGTYFNVATFFKRLLIPQLFMATGKIGNVIFILITGYFLIDKEINITKHIKKILSEFLFTVPIVVLGSFLYYKFGSSTFIGIQKFDIFNAGYWFVGYYIGIITIAYLFLNKFLNKRTKDEYIIFLTIMFSIFSLGFLRNGISEISDNVMTLFVGVFVYALGGFIRLYNPFKNVRSIILFLIIAATIAAIFINNYNEALISINTSKIKGLNGIYQTLDSYGEYHIYNILIGVSMFELFKRIKMKEYKTINYIASATFIAYIAHDNPFVINIWKESNWVAICYDSVIKYLLMNLVWIYLIFLFAILIYTLYSLLQEAINTKIFKKIIYNN